MNTPLYSARWIQVLITALLVGGAGVAAAADESPVPSQEMRGKMAAMHEKMAACLRSDRPFAECRSEMQRGCRDTMGEQHCSMMGMGMHDRMMKKPPPDSPAAK
jgi:hypothetical protein